MPNESILSEVVAASVGGAFSASALYPLEVLKTKMQAKSKDDDAAEMVPSLESSSSSSNDDSQRDKTSNPTTQSAQTSAVGYAMELYQKQGIAPFYAGIETSAFQSATEKALYFFAYTTFKNVHNLFAGKEQNQIGASMNLFLGCLAEWAHLPITLPLDCWTTQIQTGNNGNKGPLAVLMTMLSEGDGIRGMYKGIQAYTILCLKPAIQYTVFEQVKGIILIRKRLRLSKDNKIRTDNHDSDTLTAMEAFLLGMIARTVATIFTFPYLRAKVVLQSQKKADGSKSDKINIPSMIVKMYTSGGLGECFQGLGPELTRGVFSAALMMMMKEKIAFVVRKALQAS